MELYFLRVAKVFNPPNMLRPNTPNDKRRRGLLAPPHEARVCGISAAGTHIGMAELSDCPASPLNMESEFFPRVHIIVFPFPKKAAAAATLGKRRRMGCSGQGRSCRTNRLTPQPERERKSVAMLMIYDFRRAPCLHSVVAVTVHRPPFVMALY